MGECGCASTSPHYQMPGPDGVTYGIQIYPSCHYCSTPAAVDIYRFDDSNPDNEFWLQGVPELPFQPYVEGQVDAQAAIPVVSPEHLAAALDVLDDADIYMRREEMAQVLPDAVHETLKEWRSG